MPIRHVVILTFNEGTTTDQIDALTTGLRELPGLIPELLDYHVGPNAGIDPGTADFAIIANFASAADYAVYRDHAEHQARIRDLVRPIVAERRAVQFELGPRP